MTFTINEYGQYESDIRNLTHVVTNSIGKDVKAYDPRYTIYPHKDGFKVKTPHLGGRYEIISKKLTLQQAIKFCEDREGK